MQYDRELHAIVLGMKDCTRCYPNKGKVCSYKVCPECNGTGLGKRGKKGGCRNSCFKTIIPLYHVVDWDNPVNCHECGGNYQNQANENDCDSVSREIVREIPFKFEVVRLARENNWNENYLGCGCFYSCQDYGRTVSQTDKVILSKLQDDFYKGSHQLTKFLINGQLCTKILFVVTTDGYSVRASL